MFKLFAHLINNVKPVFKLSILVFWNVRLGYHFSNARFSIFRFIQFYPLAIFTDYSMNKDITSSAYQWPSRITGTHPHHLICRRSSVCSWTCLFNRTVRPPPRGCSFFFFLFGFFGLTKRAIMSGSIPSSIVSDTFTKYPSPSITLLAYNFINSADLVFVLIFSFRSSWRAWRRN